MTANTIMGILIDHRVQEAVRVQEILTEHGCAIHGRFGMHETNDDSCSDEGLIVLALSGKQDEIDALKKSLLAMEGVKVNVMEIA